MDDYQARQRELSMRYCEEMAGPVLAEMLSSQSKAESYLDHPDSNLRRAALQVIPLHWSPTSLFRNVCLRMMGGDRDIAVRVQALGAFMAALAKPDPAEVLARIVSNPPPSKAEKEVAQADEVLARIVFDPSQPLELRQHAYLWLLCIRKMPTSQWPEVTSPEFQSTDDPDWPLVRDYLKEPESE